MFSTFNFFLIFSWVWGISPIFFVLTYSIDLPKTCSRPLADLWYLAPETPESPLKIFHSFMDFHQYLFFAEIFWGVTTPQRRGILSFFRWYIMQIISKPIFGTGVAPKGQFFPRQLWSDKYTILNSTKFPGADLKDFSIKSILPAQNDFKEIFERWNSNRYWCSLKANLVLILTPTN